MSANSKPCKFGEKCKSLTNPKFRCTFQHPNTTFTSKCEKNPKNCGKPLPKPAVVVEVAVAVAVVNPPIQSQLDRFKEEWS